MDSQDHHEPPGPDRKAPRSQQDGRRHDRRGRRRRRPLVALQRTACPGPHAPRRPRRRSRARPGSTPHARRPPPSALLHFRPEHLASTPANPRTGPPGRIHPGSPGTARNTHARRPTRGRGPRYPNPRARPQPWIVLDTTRYPLNAEVVDHYTALPQAYTWPLPQFDQLELICYDSAEHPHLGILQAPDGRLFNWGDERRFLTDDLERDRIDSSELATIAFPGAFLEPLRAAAHAVCAHAHDDRLTEADD